MEQMKMEMKMLEGDGTSASVLWKKKATELKKAALKADMKESSSSSAAPAQEKGLSLENPDDDKDYRSADLGPDGEYADAKGDGSARGSPGSKGGDVYSDEK